MKRTCLTIVLLGVSLAVQAQTDVVMWSVPTGAGPAGFEKREGWKEADSKTRFDAGAAVDNGLLGFIATPGAAGVAVRSRDGAVLAELRLIGTNGSTGPVGRVWVKDADATEATLGFSAGSAEAELALGAGMSYVAVAPGKNAAKLAVFVRAPYALSPSFTTEDTIYEAKAFPGAVLPAVVRQALLQLVEGGNGIVALMWKDATGAGLDATRKAGAEADQRTVELAAANGVFTSATLPLAGKPAFVALLQAPGIWNRMEARKVPGGKPTPLPWVKPFEAAWKVDMHVTDYNKDEIAAFLKQAADAGLSKDNENDWRNFFLTLDETRKDTDPLRVEASYFKSVAQDAALPPAKSGETDPEARPWPFVFRGAQTLVTIPADWPCYPDPTKERLEALKGKPIPALIHVYGSLVMYPLDRTDKTPLAKRTVVDVMREALGIGPCKLDWLGNCQ